MTSRGNVIDRLVWYSVRLLMECVYYGLTPFCGFRPDLRYKTTKDLEEETFEFRGIRDLERELEEYGVPSEGVILEVGSGFGRWLVPLAGFGGSKERLLVGLEPRAEAIDQASRNLARFGHRDIYLVRGAAEGIPVSDSTVDFVLCYGVLMYCRLNQSLQELRRVLKPGGRCLIAVQGPGYEILKMFDAIRAREKKLFLTFLYRLYSYGKAFFKPDMRDNSTVLSFAPRFLKGRLESYGLTVERQFDIQYRGRTQILGRNIFWAALCQKS